MWPFGPSAGGLRLGRPPRPFSGSQEKLAAGLIAGRIIPICHPSSTKRVAMLRACRLIIPFFPPDIRTQSHHA